MAKMFSKGFKPKSTTKTAKGRIRYEALSRFSNDYGYDDKRTRLERMKAQADFSNGGRRGWTSDYNKARYLVDSGYYRCYYSDQADFLSKIYGKKTVESWDGPKIHATYSHLIGREYDAMLRERSKKAKKGGKK